MDESHGKAILIQAISKVDGASWEETVFWPVQFWPLHVDLGACVVACLCADPVHAFTSLSWGSFRGILGGV